ncbi:helix-turn-helix domain-containing protein [Hansschlegelia zhihuaiae]|uniref:helix-turn-helix domain-containing protein n=1 Tax=Hansschlegelia zhihuaiae TaxID=405005 RepID=UPI0013E8C78E|nr:AraC family transcriptional regulator [Hansschlegelia zhihuaiae]
MRHIGQGHEPTPASSRDLRRIDTADQIVRRHPAISASRFEISDNLGVGAFLFENARAGQSIKPGNVDFHVFGYRCSGARTHRVDKSCRRPGRSGGPGMSSFVAADEACTWDCEGAHEMVAVFLGREFLSHLVSEAFGVDGDLVQFEDAAFHFDEDATRLGKMIEGQLRSSAPVSTLELDAWGQLVGLHVVRRYSGLGQRAVMAGHGRLSAVKLQMAVDFITGNMGLPLRVADVAQYVSMSQFAFARAFKTSTGLSPHQFLTQARVERAQDLLGTGEQSISHIANSVGFVDQSHLTTQFRRAFGVTPARYRRALRS